MIKIKWIIFVFLFSFSLISADDKGELSPNTKIKLDLFMKYLKGEEIKPLHPIEKTLTQLGKQLQVSKKGKLRTGLIVGNCEEDCFGAVPFEFTLRIPEKGNFQVFRSFEGMFPHPDRLIIVSDYGTAELRFTWSDKKKDIDKSMILYKKCPEDQYKYFGVTDTNSECRIMFSPSGDPLKNLYASISIIGNKNANELKSLIETIRVKPILKRGLYK